MWYSYREMWSLTGEPLPEDLSEREAAACRLLQDGPMEREDVYKRQWRRRARESGPGPGYGYARRALSSR